MTIKTAKKFDLLFILRSLRKNKMDTKDIEKTHWWIAEVNAVPTAIVGVVNRTDCVEMVGPIIFPPYQGRGVGQALIDYVGDQWRKSQARKKIVSLKGLKEKEPLWLITSNAGYYLNMDFEIVEREEALKPCVKN